MVEVEDFSCWDVVAFWAAGSVLGCGNEILAGCVGHARSAWNYLEVA